MTHFKNVLGGWLAPMAFMFELKLRCIQLMLGLVGVCAVTSCSSIPPTHLGDEYVPRPEVVKLFIGGLFGPSYEIFSDGVRVRYKQADGMFGLEKTAGTEFTPDLRRWKEFREELDRINAWDWKPNYRKADVKDGTSWFVIISDGPTRVINSYGSNAYPEKYDDFLVAVRHLIGNRKYQ
jgi:hypothetical protein